MNIQTLKSEILNDPAGLGYSGKTDQQVADILNSKTRSRDAAVINTSLLVAAIDITEFSALTAVQRQYLQVVVNAESVPLVQPFKGQLGAMFPEGGPTRTRFLQLQSESISRAAELGIETVGDGHVKSARGA